MPESIPTPTSTPAPDNDPVPAYTEPKGVEPLWQKFVELLKEHDRSRFELGKVLYELQELYAKPGRGTFISKVESRGLCRSTAYRYLNFYRDKAGMGPNSPTVMNDDDIPIIEIPLAQSNGEATTPPGDPEQEPKPEPTVCSVRVTLSLKEKQQWDGYLEKLVRYFKAIGMTREDGKVIENKHDAAFFSVWAAVFNPKVTEWEAQSENH
jgi:hypothetical protein